MTAELGSSRHQPVHLPYREPTALDRDPDVRERFFGKYRGSVFNNLDPLHIGRLIVLVPDVLGALPSNWAMPCVPLTGPVMGTSFMPPPKGASVWVEFEQGDPQWPIWVGCFWEPPSTPGVMALQTATVPTTPSITMETITSGIGLADVPIPAPAPGNVVLYTAKGVVAISLDPSGITIKAPAVKILTTTFTINGAQFTVT